MSERAPTVLAGILQSTREELARRKREVPCAELGERAAAAPGGGRDRFRRALVQPGIGVIAEFKRRSPSAGPLRPGAEVQEFVAAYERGGACALSVLTEGPHFGGSLEDLALARSASRLPILRKDFVVEDYQLHEARAAGADAILLIVAALARRELTALHERARRLGLGVLVEVHDERELDAALELGAEVIGINNRDLRDFSVDVERSARLAKRIPAGVTVVAESGIEGPAQVQALAREGVAAVLVGESLMRSADPESALRALHDAPQTPLAGGARGPSSSI